MNLVADDVLPCPFAIRRLLSAYILPLYYPDFTNILPKYEYLEQVLSRKEDEERAMAHGSGTLIIAREEETQT